jgi:hypothetical protein
MPLQQLQVGSGIGNASLALQTPIVARGGQLGEAIVQELHGRYYETCYRKNMFSAASQAAVTTTVGLATTYTGLCIYNPIGSTINMVVNKVGYSFIVAFPAGSAIGLMAGYNAATAVSGVTAITPTSQFLGQPVGQGLAASAITLPTAPTVRQLLASGLTGAITTEEMVSGDTIDLEGAIIIPPGGYLAMYTSTVSGTSGMFASFQWEEVPL